MKEKQASLTKQGHTSAPNFDKVLLPIKGSKYPDIMH